MADAVYEAAVKEAFETKPLRTVLLIDDEFPTYADLARGESENNKPRFAQKERALRLYEGFRGHMICDVENDVSELKLDRLRKSDLIILDYHLGPGLNNSDRSINLLRTLANSKHFNTVVVYTAEPDQDGVWLDIIASLSGGWAEFPAALEGDAEKHWTILSDGDKLPAASHQAVMQFAKRRQVKDLDAALRDTAEKELVELGVPRGACNDIIKALIHREMGKRAGKYKDEPHRETVGDHQNGIRWVQTRNSFVAVLQKDTDEEQENNPDRLMEYLSQALRSWRPNLFQVIVSEIQNILELEALATEDELLRDPVTQTALWYYLLNTLGLVDPHADPDVKAPLMGIIDKIVDGIRRRLAADPELLKLAGDTLLGELRDAGWTKETWPKRNRPEMVSAAIRVARTDGLVKQQDILFRLNSFFSTEMFRRAHLTTGTIFYHAAKAQFFVIASPACDLVARAPGVDQAWVHSIHPLSPVVAILLHDAPVDRALADAEKALHVFIENVEKKRTFKLVNGNGQPSYEFFFANNEGRVRDDGGKTVFDAARLMPKIVKSMEDGVEVERLGQERELIYDTMEIVGQLRNINATRVLQMAGQHLSRIGLDFMKMPTIRSGRADDEEGM